MSGDKPPNLQLVVVSKPDGPDHDEQDAADSLDPHNKPRLRRSLILKSLQTKYSHILSVTSPTKPEDDLSQYDSVHDIGLIEFLSTAWGKWVELGKDRRDPDCFHPSHTLIKGSDDSEDDENLPIPPLIPSHFALHRDVHQRPSSNVMGAIGYYCTDLCTPIVSTLHTELLWDAAVVRTAVESVLRQNDDGDGDDGEENAHIPPRAAYAITTHPGHHAARDSFGGYCYLNHAAYAARLLQTKFDGAPVAILDVDYHCGNGTASVFYEDPTVLVVSIHCDPEWEYPFNSGFEDQTGAGEGVGETLHIPLPPKSTWKDQYSDAIDWAMGAIMDHGAAALVVSLGLDTYKGDRVALRRAGFELSGGDYWQMGAAMGRKANGIPTVVVQEGGYNMDVVGDAAADVVAGFVLSEQARAS